jgi:hypothetical protein
MTAASAPAGTDRRPRASVVPLPAAGRLLRLELRHNVMLWLLPLVGALFWYNGYREVMALPPMWNLRAMTLQNRLLLDLVIPVTAAAAWMGSREGRRDITDLLGVTARPRWSRQLATWAATTVWAEVGCLSCVAAVYIVTARQASGGGPLWWPAVVSVAGVPALTAIGFAAGTLFPSRFVTPLITVVAFFGLGYGTQAASGDHSYWQISPLAAGAVDIGVAPGVGTFYRYLPDLSIAQVMFTVGLTLAVLAALGASTVANGPRLRCLAAVLAAAGMAAAGTAVGLAGTGRLDPHGMIVIPALHDAASDQPVRYAPACGRTAIPVCVHPAYAIFLPDVVAAVGAELSELAGLPGAPARISQVAEVYHQGPGNSISSLAQAPGTSTFVLPDQVPGPLDVSAAQFIGDLQDTFGLNLISDVVLGGTAKTAVPSQAQLAVIAALVRPGTVWLGPADARPGGQGLYGRLVPAPGSPAAAAARRFAAVPAAAKHAWLVEHLTALRAGRVSLAQLP